jgi:hypothetical protein
MSHRSGQGRFEAVTAAPHGSAVAIIGITAIIRAITIIAIVSVGVIPRVVIVPGIVIPGTVETVPGIVVPGTVPIVVIPRIIIPGVIAPETVTPRAVETPGAGIPGTVKIIVPEIPGAVGKGIIPRPGWRIFHGNKGIILVETDTLACGDNQGVASAQDISLGRPAVGKKIVKLVLGNGRRLLRHGAGVDAVIVGLGLKPAHGCAGQSGKGT